MCYKSSYKNQSGWFDKSIYNKRPEYFAETLRVEMCEVFWLKKRRGGILTDHEAGC